MTSAKLEPVYDVDPGRPCELFQGGVTVLTDDGEMSGRGRVFFDWHAGFRFDAEGEGAAGHMLRDLVGLRLADGREFDVWSVTSTMNIPAGNWELRGHLRPQLFGDQGAPLDHVLLHVANLPRSVFGTAGDPDFRVRAGGAGWEITLDTVAGYGARAREIKLTRSGGVTHIGRLRRLDRSPFTWDELDVALGAARFLLSFTAGHRIAPLFAIGVATNGEHVVEEWGAYRRDSMGGVLNWCSDLIRREALQDLWGPTLERWTDTATRQVLLVALELYLDAQKGRNIETRLVAAQACLELLAWHSLTQGGAKSERRVDRQTTPWRLRRLVEGLAIAAAVPDSLDAVKATWPLLDGPSVICDLRNRITHPTDVAGLLELPGDAKHGVLRLATWYIELVLLKLLEYRGNYLNQTRPLPIFEGRGDSVPWV